MNGRIIAGRYELSTVIGQGGMGQVWTAYDQRLDRRVAVKLLRPDRMAAATAADEMRRRFVRECRVTAQVDHPGLVTVHDARNDDDLYLVMQYVEGADLADHLAEHDPYPWPWAVSVAAQLCAVLSAVHAVPIVHRDLKPRNVMVKPEGTVTVLDLGVASVLDTDTTRLTHTGSPIGQPRLHGARAGDGRRGRPVHRPLRPRCPPARTPQRQRPLRRIDRPGRPPPPPLRAAAPRPPAPPGVPEPLEALVLRLLAKDPQHRPSSAQEVYEALAPLLPGHGGIPSGPLDPTRPFLRPHAPWPDRATTPPAAQPAPAQAQPDVAGGVDEVKQLLGEGRITQAVDILGGILPAAAAQHGERSPVVRILRKQYAATLLDDGQYRRALPELRRLADDRAAEAGLADPQALQFRYEAAQCLEQLGEPAAALAEYRALLPYYENQYGGGPAAADATARAFDIRHRTANLLLAMGDHAAAHSQLQSLLYDAERVYGPVPPAAGRGAPRPRPAPADAGRLRTGNARGVSAPAGRRRWRPGPPS